MFGYDSWLVLWENRPLWGWKERFTHPGVTMIVLWASFPTDIFWLPNGSLLLLTPNMHAFLNISTNRGSFKYAILKSPYFSTSKRVIFSQHASQNVSHTIIVWETFCVTRDMSWIHVDLGENLENFLISIYFNYVSLTASPLLLQICQFPWSRHFSDSKLYSNVELRPWTFQWDLTLLAGDGKVRVMSSDLNRDCNHWHVHN